MAIQRILVLPCVLLVAAGLASCSDADDKQAATSSPSGSASASVVKAAKLPGEPAVKDAKPATGDVTLGTCSTKAGDVTVQGSLVSSASTATDYVVTINWLAEDFTVVGRGSAVVRDVQPKATAKFTIKTTVGTGAHECRPIGLSGEVVG